MNEINKQAKSITIINNGIAFSQFGIAKEILDLVDNQQQEIKRLNNIINELEKYIGQEWYCFVNESIEFEVARDILDKLKQLKENK